MKGLLLLFLVISTPFAFSAIDEEKKLILNLYWDDYQQKKSLLGLARTNEKYFKDAHQRNKNSGKAVSEQELSRSLKDYEVSQHAVRFAEWQAKESEERWTLMKMRTDKDQPVPIPEPSR